MTETETRDRVTIRLWGQIASVGEREAEEYENAMAALEVERTTPNQVALHLSIDGEGSFVSYYFDPDSALELAEWLLHEARTR